MGTITIKATGGEKFDSKIKFLNKYFKEEQFIEIDADNMKHVKILSGNPKTDELIVSEEFKNDFNNSGFRTMTFDISWVENPFVDCNGKFDGGVGMLPRMRQRDYCDTLTFKI